MTDSHEAQLLAHLDDLDDWVQASTAIIHPSNNNNNNIPNGQRGPDALTAALDDGDDLGPHGVNDERDEAKPAIFGSNGKFPGTSSNSNSGVLGSQSSPQLAELKSRVQGACLELLTDSRRVALRSSSRLFLLLLFAFAYKSAINHAVP